MKQKKLHIGLISSPIETLDLNPKSPSYDSTVQLMHFGRNRHHLSFIPAETVQFEQGKVTGICYQLDGFSLTKGTKSDLTGFDILVIRKDPPFDDSYVALAQILCYLESSHPTLRIINSPSGLLKYNEKSGIMYFPEFTPKSLISSSIQEIKEFLSGQKTGIVVKGLDNKGGSNIFKLKKGDPNTNEILSQITKDGHVRVMCQEYLPMEKTGDKRVTIINGQIIGGFLRTPGEEDFRGNICKGASAVPAMPTRKEAEISQKIATHYVVNGVSILGIDFIGGKVTEINITSPLLSKKFMPEVERIFFEYLENL